jgi:hypothetical protein
MYEKYDDVLVGSPLFFICGDAHVKSSRIKVVRRSGAPYFLYACKKLVEAKRYVDRKPLAFCT